MWDTQACGLHWANMVYKERALYPTSNQWEGREKVRQKGKKESRHTGEEERNYPPTLAMHTNSMSGGISKC